MTWSYVALNFVNWINLVSDKYFRVELLGIMLGDIIVTLIAVDLLYQLLFGFKFFKN